MKDRIDHAQSYPFSIPEHSYVYDRGSVRQAYSSAQERHGRVPVLAAGSNQSPDQLDRKFGHLEDTVISADRGLLHDFDVVYAAHMSSYGSLPATFQASPGAAVTVFVLWLDEAQLARMHETEGNYTYDRLSGVRIALDHGETLDEAFAYSSKVGCLNLAGGCVSLSEIPAQGRRFAELAQRDVQAQVRDRLAPGTPLEAFIQAHLEDDGLRRTRSSALGTDALPLDFPRHIIHRL